MRVAWPVPDSSKSLVEARRVIEKVAKFRLEK